MMADNLPMFDMFDLEEDPDALVDEVAALLDSLSRLSEAARIHTINKIRMEIHKYSPFSNEPVDMVQWVLSEHVTANDYNPNAVAPPEMRLLEHSIKEDGFTQPIVSWKHDGIYEVVDGFHRHRVGKESKAVGARTKGYLPLVVVNQERQGRNDRIAATIRHNRARGKHRVDGMSEIVVELKRRNWSNERISRELGMDEDEILRLCQITGLAELFTDQEFSKSWDVEGAVTEDDFEGITDDIETYGDETEGFRTVNTSDENRIFHTFDKWECHKAGFFDTHVDGMSRGEAEEQYRVFLANIPRFADALEHVITEWKHSCEHYLTNVAMNRIAWMGQAAACYAMGIPAVYRGGFSLLTEAEQSAANECALTYLNKWLEANDREAVTMDVAYSGSRQSDIY
ncbi:MAG TPA: ParB N-terminal domain-containing protein [Sedimentisphaerales bacterium]|nr:ParB N-terminal domain-containing protein [Sedimentisphaerales bacterium]